MENQFKKRIIIWAIITVVILSIPAVAMLLTDEVDWSIFDFILMGTLIFGFGALFEFGRKRSTNFAYQAGTGLALAATFLLIWINGAVGIIGNEDNPANLMYTLVVLIGATGAIYTQFRPAGMAKTLLLMAIVQFLVPLVALVFWPPATISWGEAGVYRVFTLNLFFVFLFGFSAAMFRQASLASTQ